MEQRKLKLKEIGVAVDDISAQKEEATDFSLQQKITKPKEKQKATATFKKYNFKVILLRMSTILLTVSNTNIRTLRKMN